MSPGFRSNTINHLHNHNRYPPSKLADSSFKEFVLAPKHYHPASQTIPPTLNQVFEAHCSVQYYSNRQRKTDHSIFCLPRPFQQLAQQHGRANRTVAMIIYLRNPTCDYCRGRGYWDIVRPRRARRCEHCDGRGRTGTRSQRQCNPCGGAGYFIVDRYEREYCDCCY